MTSRRTTADPRVRAGISAGAALLLLAGFTAYASARGPAGGAGHDPQHAHPLGGHADHADPSAPQVLGGRREPGRPAVQRQVHDDVAITVTVAPALPGPNLVRVDVAPAGEGRDEHHDEHAAEDDGGRSTPPGVGVDDGTGDPPLVTTRTRPGTDGRWAVVDLPAGSPTLLVSHGPDHRVPFVVDTGTDAESDAESGADSAPAATAAWTGPDGPECVSAAVGAELADGAVPDRCPAQQLSAADARSLEAVVAKLAERGLRQLAVRGDGSPRSKEALQLVHRAARGTDVQVVSPAAPPGPRNALLVVSGWQDAARHLAATDARPPHRQPVRTDGTWLAPWLLNPAVVDATRGAVLALDFDIRSEPARRYSETLARYLPAIAPTASGYDAWRRIREVDAEPVRLYAATRAAYLPPQPGHGNHETQVAWFPGGTVTPVS